MAKARNPWLQIGWDTWMLGAESATVITLRSLKFATGGDLGGQEAVRMVAEKIEAAQDLQKMALTGELGDNAPSMVGNALRHCRVKVRANRRRLSR
jgi:hypothetical protein